MIKTNKFLYGTVRECVTEIVSMIDWEGVKFPDFDFCTEVDRGIDIKSLQKADDGSDLGHGWYGCKNVSYIFNGIRDGISLIFGYYGSFDIESIGFSWEQSDETELLVDLICNTIYVISMEDLDEYNETVFELV